MTKSVFNHFLKQGVPDKMNSSNRNITPSSTDEPRRYHAHFRDSEKHTPPQAQHTLPKRSPSIDALQDHDPNFRTSMQVFTSELPNTKLKISHEIPKLEDIHKQDIIAWVQNFVAVISANKWDEETSKAILNSLVTPSILGYIDPSKPKDEILKALLHIKSPATDAAKYSWKLKGVHQNQYNSIQEYVNIIAYYNTRLSLCLGLCDQENDKALIQAFLNGLSYDTQRQVTLLGLVNAQDIYHRICEVEHLIETQSQKSGNKEYHTRYIKDKYNSSRQYGNGNQYCSYHKSRGHSTADCRARTQNPRDNRNENRNFNRGRGNYGSYNRSSTPQDQYKAQNKGYNNSYNTRNYNSPRNQNAAMISKGRDSNNEETPQEPKLFAIQEPMTPIPSVELKINVDGKQGTALLDTGSCDNYISNTFHQKIGVLAESIPNKAVTLANGSTIMVDKKTKVTFQIENDANIKYTDDFFILDPSSIDVYLGRRFMINQGAIINFNDQTVSFDGKYYELPDRERISHIQSDKLLTQKAKIFSISETTEKTAGIEIQELVKSNKIRNPDLGEIKFTKHTITLDDYTPFNFRPYILPLSLVEQTQNEVNKLIKEQVIRPSDSSFCSPAFPIVKRNGSIRLVVDYRHLNSKTRKEFYPMPPIQHILGQLRGARRFSQIDLKSGYYQIGILEEDIPLTSFSLNDQQYEFLRMPFGLCNAPHTFQRAMQYLFGTHPFIKCYLDDVLIHSQSSQEHCKHLETFFNIVKDNGLAINYDKSHFNKDNVKYLGYLVDKEGIRPDLSRMDTFDLTEPKNKKQLKRIIGLIQWYRPFIKNLSDKLAFLTSMTRDTEKLTWDGDKTNLLKDLLNEIKEQTLLHFPDFANPFELTVDASNTGLGGVLYQDNKIIGFFSKKLTETEKNYSIVERETLAILRSIEHFKTIIFSNKIYVHSDNRNLLFAKDLSKRCERWKLQLEEYNLDINHIAGEKNEEADLMSRLMCLKENPTNFEFNLREIAKHTINQEIKANLQIKDKTIGGHKLKFTKEDQMIIPDTIADRLLLEIHKYLQHPGQRIQYETIRNYLYISNIKNRIKTLVGNCHACQKSKKTSTKYGFIEGNLRKKEPFKFVSTDLFGPVKTAFFETKRTEGSFYIITFLDLATRWAEARILFGITGNDICKAFQEVWLTKFEAPQHILSDQGRQYISNNWRDLCGEVKTKPIYCSSYNPTGNSPTERLNSGIALVLRLNRNKDLEGLENKIQNRLNYMVNTTTGTSAFENRFLYSPLDPIKRNLTRKIVSGMRKADEKAEIVQRKTNSKRIQHEYKENEQVLVIRHFGDKIMDPWKGPFVVIRVIDKNRIEIDEGYKKSIQNIKNVKPYAEGAGYDELS
eukprot:GAHX01002736.1.p1 GENE.GAHX01002736.1~~GAHX01002736.1.p1  ORF type:complete len:1367 (-),score=220.68 GAHX01002736.1:80-4180(-)